MRSIDDKPPGEGTDTPGANAGSMQSRSTEIYTLDPLVRALIICATLFTPISTISSGFTILKPAFLAFSSSSGSAALVPTSMLFLKLSDCAESVSTEP